MHAVLHRHRYDDTRAQASGPNVPWKKTFSGWMPLKKLCETRPGQQPRQRWEMTVGVSLAQPSVSNAPPHTRTHTNTHTGQHGQPAPPALRRAQQQHNRPVDAAWVEQARDVRVKSHKVVVKRVEEDPIKGAATHGGICETGTSTGTGTGTTPPPQRPVQTQPAKRGAQLGRHGAAYPSESITSSHLPKTTLTPGLSAHPSASIFWCTAGCASMMVCEMGPRLCTDRTRRDPSTKH